MLSHRSPQRGVLRGGVGRSNIRRDEFASWGRFSRRGRRAISTAVEMHLDLLLDDVERPIDSLDPHRDGPTGLLDDVLSALDDVQGDRGQSRRPLRCPRAKAQRRRDPTGLPLDVVQLPPQRSRRRRDANLTGFDVVEPARRRRRDRPTGLAQSLWTAVETGLSAACHFSTTSSSRLDVVEPSEVGISTTSRTSRRRPVGTRRRPTGTGPISTAVEMSPGQSSTPSRSYRFASQRRPIAPSTVSTSSCRHSTTSKGAGADLDGR